MHDEKIHPTVANGDEGKKGIKIQTHSKEIKRN